MCDYSLHGLPNRLAVEGEDLVPDLLAGRWPAAGEVAHDLRVAVQVEQVVYVVLGELANDQPWCFQDDAHLSLCHEHEYAGSKAMREEKD